MRRTWITFCILCALLAAGCGAVGGLSGLSPAGDITPPSPVSTAPTPDASVPADASIVVTFSEPMNIRSVVITAQPQISFGVGQWSTDERTVTFTPEAALNPGTKYIVSLTGKDRAGNAMAPFSWAFAAAAPGLRTGSTAAWLQDRVEARADDRLFTLYAALIASGYSQGDAEAGPVREAVREKMGDLPLRVVEPFRKFRSEHPQSLEEYIAYVLTLAGPPAFAEQRAPNDLDRLNRILADFYSAARIEDLWRVHQENHARAAGAFASDGVTVIGKVIDYVRASDLPAARTVLVPNLLDAPGRGYVIRTGEAAVLVIGTTGASDRRAITRLTASLIIGAGGPISAAALQHTEPLFDLVKGNAKSHGYSRWEHVVRESLAAAVTAQTAVAVDQRTQFVQHAYTQGLILIDHFTRELAKYDQSTVPLTEFLSQMLRTVNLDEERRKFAERRR